jgi:hypothetical protein
MTKNYVQAKINLAKFLPIIFAKMLLAKFRYNFCEISRLISTKFHEISRNKFQFLINFTFCEIKNGFRSHPSPDSRTKAVSHMASHSPRYSILVSCQKSASAISKSSM